MRRFFFDLMLGNIVKIDPGGMVFECPEATFVVANETASHLFVWRDDLRGRDACIRVSDTDGREIYRAAVWSENVEKVGWDVAGRSRSGYRDSASLAPEPDVRSFHPGSIRRAGVLRSEDAACCGCGMLGD